MFSSNLCLISTQRLTFLDQENCRNCVSGGVTFKLRYKTTGKNYRTLLNSVTDICGRYEIVASIMENIQKKVYSGVFFNKIARLQSTAYYRTKNFSTKITHKGNDVLTFQKFPQKFYKIVSFSVALQVWVQNFQPQQKQFQEKMFPLNVLKYVFENLSGRRL